MVRSVTVFDPDFTEDDMAAALAFEDDKALRCGGCGHHVDESMAMGADQFYDSEPIVCHACAARDMAIDRFRKDNGEMAGTKWRVFRRKGTR